MKQEDKQRIQIGAEGSDGSERQKLDGGEIGGSIACISITKLGRGYWDEQPIANMVAITLSTELRSTGQS